MKLSKLLLALTLVMVLTSMAFASVSVTVENLDEQDAVTRSNPYPEDNDDRLDDNDEFEYEKFEVTITTLNESITINNQNAFTVSGLNFDTIDSDFTDDEAEIVVDGINFPYTIAANSTSSFDIEILIPSDLDAVDGSGNLKSHSPTLNIKDSSNTTHSDQFIFYAESGIELTEFKIVTSRDTFDCSVDPDEEEIDCDEDDVENLIPGEDFTIVFEVKNIFKSNSELDIEDLDIEVDISGDADTDDDSFSNEDIDTEDSETYEILVEVDSDADDADIEISATDGEDPNGATHGFFHTLQVKFNLPSYEVDASNIRVSPSQVCAGDDVTVSFDVENIGKKDQDNLRAQIEQVSFDWNQVFSRFGLDGRDTGDDPNVESLSKRFTVPSNANEGDYTVRIIVYYEDGNDDETLFETVTLTVDDCNPSTTTDTGSQDGTSTDSDSGIVITPGTGTDTTIDDTQGTQTPTTGSSTVVATSKPKSNDGLFIGGLVVLVVLLIAVLASLIVILKRR